ncbi:plastidial pyruvate kinase 4, chloroplastic [Tanacetum coccineum]
MLMAGDPTVWSEIIRRAKVNSQKLEMPCRVLMDLAGPKLRTGRKKAGPCVMKIYPKRNAYGNVINPAQVLVAQKGVGLPPAHVSPSAVIYVDGQEFLKNLVVCDIVRFSDARGKQRFLKISKKFPIFTGVGFMANYTKTCYVQNGTKLYIKGNKKRSSYGCVVDVPHVESFVRLKVGDLCNTPIFRTAQRNIYGCYFLAQSHIIHKERLKRDVIITLVPK